MGVNFIPLHGYVKKLFCRLDSLRSRLGSRLWFSSDLPSRDRKEAFRLAGFFTDPLARGLVQDISDAR